MEGPERGEEAREDVVTKLDEVIIHVAGEAVVDQNHK